MTKKEAYDRLMLHRDWGFADSTMQALHIAGKALEKEIEKQPVEKTDTFGDRAMACPTCGQTAIANPFRQQNGITLYPHCPWCGQKLKGGQR